ncbi:MAG: outer membrane beta-barrel protein, partial [Mucilaginibacter sp.]
GYFNGKGKPVASSGGAHYDGKWDGDKQSINTNYKIGQITLTGTTTSTSQQTLPTGINDSYSNQNFNDYSFRQKLDLTYQIKLDTATNLKISLSGTDKNFHVVNDYTTETDSAGVKLNDNRRTVDNRGNEHILGVSALFTHKFKKVGRTLSWAINESYDQTKTDGYLNSLTQFFSGTTAHDSTINQFKPTNAVTQSLKSNITYTEPITKKLSVLFNYGISINNATSNNQSYNQSSPGVYDVFDPTYSNDYKFNQLDNQVGAIINYKYKKTIFNIGTKVSDNSYTQTNEYNGDVMTRNFINWYPQAMYQYKFGPQSTLTINYRGNTTQPSIQQIQPLITNTDPLNITLGNPNLSPSFMNNIYGWYNLYHIISGLSVWINGGYNNTLNAIVNSTVTENGKNTIQYVNLHGETPYNYYFWGNIGDKIKPIDTYVGLRLNSNANVSYSYINNELDQASSHTYGAELNIQKVVEKKYDFYLNAGPNYNFSTMSLQPNVNNNAAGFAASGSINVFLPLKFGTGSNVDYNYLAKTAALSAQYKTIWNAYIFKTFLKDDKLKISASVNDLLNQNVNYSRGIYGNTTTQTNTTGIRRFFMFSVVWNFTKFATTNSNDQSK